MRAQWEAHWQLCIKQAYLQIPSCVPCQPGHSLALHELFTCNPRNPKLQVGQLEERLAELEAERAELAAFQAADAQRRSLEYAIYDREAADARAKLEEVSTGQSGHRAFYLALPNDCIKAPEKGLRSRSAPPSSRTFLVQTVEPERGADAWVSWPWGMWRQSQCFILLGA